MSEPTDKTPSSPLENDEPASAPSETSAPDKTAERDAQDPDDEATVIEPPDPGFVAPAE